MAIGRRFFEGGRPDSRTGDRLAVEQRQGQYEQAAANREAVEALGWRERRQKLPRAIEREELLRERLDENVIKLEGMEQPGTALRREHEITGELLAKRSEQALTAAHIEPPRYILKELRERPTDPARRKAWDRGVEAVESYRQAHGVTDRQSALGWESKSAAREAARESDQTRQGAPAGAVSGTERRH